MATHDSALDSRTLLDPWDAGTAANVSCRTIRRYVARGALTNHGTDRRIRVDLDQVLDVFGDAHILR